MVRTPVVHPWGYNKKIAMPSPEALSKAFAELGTQKEVAMFFNVSKATVLKWEIQLGMNVESHVRRWLSGSSQMPRIGSG
ncbi:MAG TPA: hypothetical protein VEC08_01095 [Nitrososphaerales archaeon]|nr:hypothetical protein [Nitrososphaerales archaeon]